MKKTQKRLTLDDVLKEKFKEPGFKFRFEIGTAVLQIARIVRALRKKAKLTQTELAKRSNTTQAVIARLESGRDKRIPSSDLLFRIAYAANARMSISFDFDVAA